MTPFVRAKATPNHFLLTHRRLVARRRVMLFALSLVAAFSFGCSGGDDANGVDDLTSASPLPPVRLRVRVDSVRLEPFAADQAVTGTVRAFHKATITAETQGRVLARKLQSGAAVEAGGRDRCARVFTLCARGAADDCVTGGSAHGASACGARTCSGRSADEAEGD